MELMKNGLNPAAIQRIARALNAIKVPGFKQQAFIQQASAPLEALELKQRVDHLIDTLHQHLPQNFTKTAPILKRLPKIWDRGDEDDPLRGFAAWPLIDYVGRYGLDHPELGLSTLKSLTPLFSAEFAIRPFLLQHPKLCQQHFSLWVNDDCEHVRRLVSEGSRPRLPWGMQLKPYMQDPGDNLPWLSALKDDPSLYVRRSVANHLNDISKDHPQIVIDLCRSWLEENQPSDEIHWVVRHATRTLIKQGHPESFPLLGYSESPLLRKPTLTLANRQLVLGDSLEFQLTLQSDATATQRMVVDFALHFMKANGKTAAKVFKWKSVELKAGEVCHLEKRHGIKAITTRRYYSGTQVLEVLINGVPVAQQEFQLDV